MSKIEGETINYVSDLTDFIKKMEQAKITVSKVKSKSEIIHEVHSYVRKYNVESAITLENNSDLTSLNWQGVDVTTDYKPEALTVSVSYAWMGIEETGTLVITSSPASPTGMNFLPDHHIVVINGNSVVKRMEDVWNRLRQSDQEIPRTINLITGPSRTADIEYKIEIGAHGPKHLHVILIQP